MHREVFRYSFDPEISMQEVEETLHLSILAVEGLHGESQVRLDASYCIAPEKHVLVVDASTAVGSDLARIFTSFAIREFGYDAFSVRQAEPKTKPEMAEVQT